MTAAGQAPAEEVQEVEREPREITVKLGDYDREPVDVSLKRDRFSHGFTITHEEARLLRDALLPFVSTVADQTPATDSERVKVFPDDYGWDDLMTLVDHHWPTDVFPAALDSTDRDTGPRILSLARLLAEQAATIERVRGLCENADDDVVTQADGVHIPVYLVFDALGSQRTEGQG